MMRIVVIAALCAAWVASAEVPSATQTWRVPIHVWMQALQQVRECEAPMWVNAIGGSDRRTVTVTGTPDDVRCVDAALRRAAGNRVEAGR